MIGSVTKPLHEQQVDRLLEVRRWSEANCRDAVKFFLNFDTNIATQSEYGLGLDGWRGSVDCLNEPRFDSNDVVLPRDDSNEGRLRLLLLLLPPFSSNNSSTAAERRLHSISVTSLDCSSTRGTLHQLNRVPGRWTISGL
uniref:Uncharacterized protein n=1 Tax=Grammatophora oceanica TaxID=210454 RepID=A0A7S1UXI6_9STRA